MGNKTDAVLENQAISDVFYRRLTPDCQGVRTGSVYLKITSPGGRIVYDPFFRAIIHRPGFGSYGEAHGIHN